MHADDIRCGTLSVSSVPMPHAMPYAHKTDAIDERINKAERAAYLIAPDAIPCSTTNNIVLMNEILLKNSNSNSKHTQRAYESNGNRSKSNGNSRDRVRYVIET